MKMPIPAGKRQREIQEELFCGLLPACVTWSLAHTCDFGEWWLLGKAEQTLWVSFSLFCSSRIKSFLTLPHAASVITMRGFCILSKEHVHFLRTGVRKFVLQCLPPFLFSSLSLFFLFFLSFFFFFFLQI